MAVVSREFATWETLVNVLLRSSTNTVLAVGMTFVIISAGIDLSVGRVLALCSVVLALLARSPLPFGWGVYLAIPAALAVGSAVGAAQGLVIAAWRVAPFIVTLGTYCAAWGAALLLSGGQTIHNIGRSLCWPGAGKIGAAPIVPPLLSIAAVAIAHVVLAHTAFGRHLFAVGANEEAARLSGIHTGRVKLTAYTLCGLAAGVAGVLAAGKTNSGSPILGEGAELDAIAAAVIGGNSLMGGQGTVVGALVGSLMISVIRTGLVLGDVAASWQLIIIGLVIVAAATVDQIRRSRAHG
jgi:ribose/xylose/arabinose/galactoside ABC-type transport system permease subunit